MLRTPADLGYDASEYILPKLNNIQHTVNLDDLPGAVRRWWDGNKYVFSETQDESDWISVQGNIIRYTVRFTGQADAREPSSHVQSWTYEIFGQYDPENRVKEGAGDDVWDRWDSPPTPDEWEMSASDDGVEIFIPNLIWLNPSLFDPGFPFYAMGVVLARQLGEIQIHARGKTTRQGDNFEYCFLTVRETCGSNASRVQLGPLGRRTGDLYDEYKNYLGLDPANTGAITEFWPPEGYVPDEDL